MLSYSRAATGWFGRGAAGAAAKYSENNKRYLERPARKQRAAIECKCAMRFYIFSPPRLPRAATLFTYCCVCVAKNFQRPEGANEFNIWYGKWIGEHWDATLGKGRRALSFFYVVRSVIFCPIYRRAGTGALPCGRGRGKDEGGYSGGQDSVRVLLPLIKKSRSLSLSS